MDLLTAVADLFVNLHSTDESHSLSNEEIHGMKASVGERLDTRDKGNGLKHSDVLR